MSRNSINEAEYKNKVKLLYDGELEVVGRYKSLTSPILIRDKYGVMQLPKANQVLNNRPGIKAALNKTEYFMAQLKDTYPEIANKIKPESEYESMKSKMLFSTKYGVVTTTPDALLAGHMPTIRSAIDRKQYMKNQLFEIYGNKYDFEILSTDRHVGKVKLICPIHGEVLIDNDYIFAGCGCIKCNTNWEKSDTLYIVKLTNNLESFYKLGITHIVKNKPSRYKSYKKMGYEIEQIYLKTFDSYEECFQKELALKQLIKNNLYKPIIWENKCSTECFDKNLLEIVIDNL